MYIQMHANISMVRFKYKAAINLYESRLRDDQFSATY